MIELWFRIHRPKLKRIRLWVLVNRQNKTVRPDTPIPENESALSKILHNCRDHILIAFYPQTWR